MPAFLEVRKCVEEIFGILAVILVNGCLINVFSHYIGWVFGVLIGIVLK